MKLEFLDKLDLDKLLEIEQEAFIAPWSKEGFISEIEDNPFSHIIVAKNDDEIIGYIDYWVTFEVVQLNKIAVRKDVRRQGIAKSLFKAMLDSLNKEEVDIVTLEVRTHNSVAINFYEQVGFEKVLKKPHYYENGDDAWYMIKRLGESYE